MCENVYGISHRIYREYVEIVDKDAGVTHIGYGG